MADGWRATLPCTRAEAEAVERNDGPLAALADPPTVTATEPDPHLPDDWLLHAYFDREPTAEDLQAIRAMAPSARAEPLVERLPDEDWVALSQAGLDPIIAGRFFVHTGREGPQVPAKAVPLVVDAGRAFGTGHHETTAGCLLMLEAIADRSFTKLVDLGTGTGLLAIAAKRLWPGAEVVATDIDPVAVEVAAANAVANAAADVALVVADGVHHPEIAARAPYPLVIANILAEPLIAMAADVRSIAAPGSVILLAGLLNSQADAVLAAYAAQGCTEEERLVRGDWTILRLEAR
ncbi:MAG: Ribosomal protein L11 methyltransferase [uncultured Sphingomonadaceae bacterium]|uniref:Ribosomal protein L11 methyltransferase n=1 Tax=uncultured Sphingomonadaceae bacterium TaxID=169976 RepID=A0A6J4S216_9SPHN|nr:MAG: Ribosomal protein L11 methyltransferase [uncultured Sphingomonadaceae bacterium]